LAKKKKRARGFVSRSSLDIAREEPKKTQFSKKYKKEERIHLPRKKNDAITRRAFLQKDKTKSKRLCLSLF